MKRPWEPWVLFGMPAVVLLGSLGAVFVACGSPWPWLQVVHEDGIHTLLGVLFHFEHAARELPLDLVLAAGIGGAARYFLAPPPPACTAPDRRRLRNLLGAGALVSTAVVLGGTVIESGVDDLLSNLSQVHTRPGAPLVWGAHWRFHLLSRLALLLLGFCTIGVLAPRRGGRNGRPRARLFGVALGGFAVLSVVFGLNGDPLRDPVYLGHQVREILTHMLVTVPLSIGVCLRVARSTTAPAETVGAPTTRWPVAVTGTCGVAIALFVLLAGLASDAQSMGQTSDVTRLVFVHFLEHGPGYVIVPLCAGFLALPMGSRSG